MEYCRKPCAECPWRRDVPPGKFSRERFIALAHTAYDLAAKVFACHMTNEGKEIACAGFVMMQGGHNLSLRLMRKRFEITTDAALYRTYREMAIANGVPKKHPALRQCRDDGQTYASEPQPKG